MKAPSQTGLCDSCEHAREIRSARGSRFLLCGLAATDPRYRRYPQLPVPECRGFSERAGNAPRSAIPSGTARTTN